MVEVLWHSPAGHSAHLPACLPACKLQPQQQQFKVAYEVAQPATAAIKQPGKVVGCSCKPTQSREHPCPPNSNPLPLT